MLGYGISGIFGGTANTTDDDVETGGGASSSSKSSSSLSSSSSSVFELLPPKSEVAAGFSAPLSSDESLSAVKPNFFY